MAPPPAALAPVVLFAYARPEHLRQTVESLLANDQARETDLHVFCDGAKDPQLAAQVEAVRRYADGITGFRSVSRVYRDYNLGLAGSVIDGVTRVVRQYGRVIVVEDDLVLSPHFLSYMNEALGLYENDPQVASIHGYCYPTREALPASFFLRGADCWGWATWERSWREFEPDGTLLLAELKARNLMKRFDYGGHFGFTRMLKDQAEGRNSSWAIRWHATCFLAGRLTLYPGRSLVHNTGFDSSGRHCETRTDYDQQVSQQPIELRRIALEESQAAWHAFAGFFHSLQPPVHLRLLNHVRRGVSWSIARAPRSST